jgi:hypothetical protein
VNSELVGGYKQVVVSVICIELVDDGELLVVVVYVWLPRELALVLVHGELPLGIFLCNL